MSNPINDGGPAFPMHPTAVPAMASALSGIGYTRGMSLRDWFAGQALAGQIAHECHEDPAYDIYAADAYAFADAMLAARAKEPKP